MNASHPFDTILDRSGTGAIKWDLRQSIFGSPDALPFWVADMDFPSPPAVSEALSRRAAHPTYGYTMRPSTHFSSLQKWVQKRHGWSTEVSWYLHSPAVVTSLSVLVETLTRPGDKVLIQPPVYAPFFEVIRNNDRIPSLNRLVCAGGRYAMDFSALERDLEGVKLAILCSPHNPVGRVWETSELRRFAEACVARGIPIVSDEIHSDLVFSGGKHVPLASLGSEISRHVITCLSPSKTFNMAGMGASVLVVEDPELRKKVEKGIARFGLDLTNAFAATAFSAAYMQGEPWLEELLPYLEANRDFLSSELAREVPHITMSPTQGTYLAWLDFTSLGLDDAELKKFLVHEAHVALEPGAKFGPGGERHARFNFACPRSLLAKGVGQLVKALLARRT